MLGKDLEMGPRGVCFSAERAHAATMATHGLEGIPELVGMQVIVCLFLSMCANVVDNAVCACLFHRLCACMHAYVADTACVAQYATACIPV